MAAIQVKTMQETLKKKMTTKLKNSTSSSRETNSKITGIQAKVQPEGEFVKLRG